MQVGKSTAGRAIRASVSATGQGDGCRRRPLQHQSVGHFSSQNSPPQPQPIAKAILAHRCPRCSNHLPVSESEDNAFFCPVCSIWVPTTARGEDGRGDSLLYKKVRV